jgi:LacI family transcriptional regulator
VTVTISHIAKEAGVSQATVSRVLNDSSYVKEETKEKVLKVINELNYVPSAIARSLSTSKTNTIGVIIPDINNSLFGEIIKGISEVADMHNLNIILCDADEKIEKELKALKFLKEQRIQGIIIIPTSVEDEFNGEYVSILESMGIPIVLLEGHVKSSKFSGIYINNIDGAYMATETLVKEGHKKIATITGRMTSEAARDRLEGYKKALHSNNIAIEEKYIFNGDYKIQSGYMRTKEILEMEDKPTAIFVSSNMMTLGCIKALNDEKVRVPEDMAIIGFDNLEILNIVGMNISYTSSPTIEMGKRSMKMLIDILKNDNKDEIKNITLMPELILKGSEKRISR